MTAVLSDYKDGFAATGYGASATVGPVSLLGGKYGLTVVAGGTISIQLQALGADGTTYVDVGSAITAEGQTVFDLPPGVYQATTGSSSSGVNLALARIPYRGA